MKLIPEAELLTPGERMDKQVVLVVDDTSDNIDVISGILRSDYKVKAALSGQKP